MEVVPNRPAPYDIIIATYCRPAQRPTAPAVQLADDGGGDDDSG